VLASCASHSEPSRLDVALEVLAQVHYQVGFASLELDLGVGGELVLPGKSVTAWCWWQGAGRRRSGLGFCLGAATGCPIASLRRNPRFIPTPAGRWWWARRCWGRRQLRDLGAHVSLVVRAASVAATRLRGISARR
jgi:hypothetical protein